MEFRYVAQDKQTGRRVVDFIVAENISSAVLRLNGGGMLPLKMRAVAPRNGQFDLKNIFNSDKVTGKQLTVFTRQLAATLSAGLLLTDALITISEDMENEYFKGLLIKAKEDIQGGMDFSSALGKYPKVFPVMYVAMVKSGEVTGNLSKTMTNLAKHLEYTELMKEKIKSAIRYPLFILSFAIFVVSIIVLFLIPQFSKMFSEAGAKLPLLTRIVVGISDFVIHQVFIFAGIIVTIVAAYIYFGRKPKVRYQIDRFKLKLPLVGKEIIHKGIVSRFCSTLGFLLNGGVGLSASLEITSQVADHEVMTEAIEKIRQRVVAGSSISEEIRAHKIFPRLVSKMAAVGEKTGRVDEMLKRTADYYNEELQITIQNLTALLEPALIIFIGGVVLIVVLALYLPIFHIASAIR
jgi:type IV pilus assembly protein PilC